MVLPDPEALLTRRQTAAALHDAGFPVAEATLTTRATRGGGPEFHKFGPKVLYRWGTAHAWAQARLQPATATTSAARQNERPKILAARNRRLHGTTTNPTP